MYTSQPCWTTTPRVKSAGVTWSDNYRDKITTVLHGRITTELVCQWYNNYNSYFVIVVILSRYTSDLRATRRHLHMRSYSVTRHPTQVNSPRLTPARQAGTRLSYPGGMEGWVDLGGCLHYYILRLFICQQITHPSSNWARWSRPACYVQNPSDTFHRNFPVDGEVANLLRTF